MCNFFSAIMTKSKILWSIRSDFHDMILCEHGYNTTKNIVRIEYIPDYAKPLDDRTNWEFIVTPGPKPNWFDVNKQKKIIKVSLESSLKPL